MKTSGKKVKPDPKVPSNIVLEAIAQVETTTEAVYNELCKQWRACKSLDDRPSQITLSRAVGIGPTSIRRRMATLVQEGRVVAFGHNTARVHVPNTKEFLGERYTGDSV